MPITFWGSQPKDLFGDVTRGLGMKESGVSEFFGGSKDSLVRKAYAEMPTPTNTVGGSTGRTGEVYGPAYDPSLQVLGGSTPVSGSSSKTSSSKSSEKDDAKREAEEQRRLEQERYDAETKQIENEFNNLMGSLGMQESSLRAQLPLTEQQIGQSYGELIPQIEYERGQRVSDLESQQATGESQTGGVISSARRTYNELLSGANKFGGSAQEAYGELLGRSTADTIGQAKNNLAQLVTEIQGEMGRVRNFYQSKITDLNQKKTLAIQQAKRDMENEIAKINQARTEAEGWKANRRLDALTSFKQNVFEINQAATAYQRTLEQWEREKEEAAQAAANQAYNKFALTYTNVGNIAKGVGDSGYQLSPEAYQRLYGTVGNVPDEELWGNVFNPQNMTQVSDQIPNQIPDQQGEIPWHDPRWKG